VTEKSRNDDLARRAPTRRELGRAVPGKNPEEGWAEYAGAFDWGQDIGPKVVEE
jgi:hypothetical protein